MRDTCDALAQQGFLALCPDLVWRIEPGIDITDKTQAEWDSAFELFGLFDVDKGIADMKEALATLRAHEACTGQAGSVGYSLGGQLAFQNGRRTRRERVCQYVSITVVDVALKQKYLVMI